MRLVRCLTLLGMLLAFPRFSTAQTDSEIISELQAKQQVLRQKILETDNVTERTKLQRQLVELLDDTLNRVSARSRPMVAVSLKLLRPLMEDAAASARSVDAFFNGPEGSFVTLKSQEEINARVSRVDELSAASEKVIVRINTLEADMEGMLKDAGVSASDREDFVAGLRESSLKSVGAFRTVLNLNKKIFEQWKLALRLLDIEWGHWRTTEGARIAWETKDAEKKFRAILHEVATLADRQTEAENIIRSAY